MDIRAGIITSTLLAAAATFLLFRAGIRTYRSAAKLNYYSLRRQYLASFWRLMFASAFMLVVTIWLGRFGESTAFRYFPPSSTPTLTPTITVIPSITLSPTITLTPTITDTPLVSDTPTITTTPFVPLGIEALFDSVITPNPEAAFSPLQFSTVYRNFECVAPSTSFVNPIRSMTACFSYNNMTPGVQWTALWYRGDELLHFETIPWDGATGGLGFSEWAPPPDLWLPGLYEVQIFVGHDWKVVGQFLVSGDPLTSTPSLTSTITNTPTATQTPVPGSTSTP